MRTISLEQYIKQLGNFAGDIRQIIKDIAVLSADEFDLNFERQSFFGKVWEPSEYVRKENEYYSKKYKKSWNRKLLQKTGLLRKSIKYKIAGNTIIFGSSVSYAEIHNEGGIINHPGGTAFFKKGDKTIWISNRKAYGKKYPRTKPHIINIPQRQFVGEHPELLKAIETEILNNLENKL